MSDAKLKKYNAGEVWGAWGRAEAIANDGSAILSPGETKTIVLHDGTKVTFERPEAPVERWVVMRGSACVATYPTKVSALSGARSVPGSRVILLREVLEDDE